MRSGARAGSRRVSEGEQEDGEEKVGHEGGKSQHSATHVGTLRKRSALGAHARPRTALRWM